MLQLTFIFDILVSDMSNVRRQLVTLHSSRAAKQPMLCLEQAKMASRFNATSSSVSQMLVRGNMIRSSVLPRPVRMIRQSGSGARILVRSTRAIAPFFNVRNQVVSSGNRIVRLTGPGAG